jgi:hypothetical protein
MRGRRQVKLLPSRSAQSFTSNALGLKYYGVSVGNERKGVVCVGNAERRSELHGARLVPVGNHTLLVASADPVTIKK